MAAAELRAIQDLLARPTQARNLSAKTIAEYSGDWKRFSAWCQRTKRQSLPASPETVLQYFAHLVGRGYKAATAVRQGAAINSYHRFAGHERPAGREAREFLTAVKRLRCERPRQMHPITPEQLREITLRLPQTARGIRNRAILLVAYGSALRRANIAAMDLADVRITEEGLVLSIRREKQDRRGEGRTVAVVRGHGQTCPVAALEAWLAVRGSQPTGALFSRQWAGKHGPLLPRQIGEIVKSAVKLIGLSPDRWAGHSLRSGCISQLIAQRVPDLSIAAHSGHALLESVRTYHRRRDAFAGNVTALLGL